MRALALVSLLALSACLDNVACHDQAGNETFSCKLGAIEEGIISCYDGDVVTKQPLFNHYICSKG